MEQDPVPTRKIYAGWTVERQALFLRHLAASGSVSQSAAVVGMSPRSAYYLRNRADAEGFRAAWKTALQLAADALLGIAYDRAVSGSMQKYYRDGELIGERLVPSDRMLVWLLQRLNTHSALVAPAPPVRPHQSDALLHQLQALTEFGVTAMDHEEQHAAYEAQQARYAEQHAAMEAVAEVRPRAQHSLPAAGSARAPSRTRRARPHESV
jgi:hypothetical protein